MLPKPSKSTLKRQAIWLLVVMIVLIAGFQWRNAEMDRFAGGQNAAPLDGRTHGYTPDEAADLLRSLGKDGRTFYAISEVSLDLVFPLIYGAFFAVLVWLLWEAPWRSLLAMATALTVFADLTENILIACMAITFAEGPHSFAHTANVATILKWVLLATILAGVIVGGLRCVVLRHSIR